MSHVITAYPDEAGHLLFNTYSLGTDKEYFVELDAKRAAAFRIRSGQTAYVWITGPQRTALMKNSWGISSDVIAEGKWPQIWDTFVAHARMRVLGVR